MPLSRAQCTNCGANLSVDNSKDAAICPFCGTAYIVEKAIQNFNISKAESVTDKCRRLMIRAKQCAQIGDYKNAQAYYRQIIDLNPCDAQAFIGALFCIFNVNSYDSLYNAYIYNVEKQNVKTLLCNYPDFLYAIQNANNDEKKRLEDLSNRIDAGVAKMLEIATQELNELKARVSRAQIECDSYNVKYEAFIKEKNKLEIKYRAKEPLGIGVLFPIPILICLFHFVLHWHWVFSFIVAFGVELVGGWMLGFILEDKVKSSLDKRKQEKLSATVERIRPNLPQNEDIVVGDVKAYLGNIEGQYTLANQKVSYLRNLLATGSK